MSSNKKTSNNQLKAHEYTDNGWNIFPLTPGEKTPFAKMLPNGSQNSTIETPLTDEDIDRVWSQFPDANIGVHTGEPSLIAVIDIDVAKTPVDIEAGKRTPTQAELLKDQLLSLGATLVHKTPSGGYHLIYHFTPLCKNVGRKINAYKHLPNMYAVQLTPDLTVDLANIDVLAGNGYVVLPPSQIKDKHYEVISDTFDGLADFPEELLRLLNRRDKVAKTYFDMKDGLAKPITSSNSKEKKLETTWELEGRKKLITRLQKYMGAGSGERHDALIRACGTIFSQLPYREWKNANDYIDMVIETFNPPYFRGTPAEIEADKTEIRNAFNYAKANEYVERVHGQEKDLLNEEVATKTGLEVVQELGGSITEDEYRSAVDECYKAMQKDEKGNIVPNDYNIVVILREHPKYKGRVRYDGFLEQSTYKCKIGSQYRDHFLEDNKDNPAIARLIQDIQIDFFPKVPRTSVYSAAVSIAHDAEYDSYRESMESLDGKWDSVPRMEMWLQKMFSCPDDVYHRGVSAQFIFAMVRRAYEPGADFQKALFLSGEQGIGKGYSMSVLATQQYYHEFKDEISGREFDLQAKGKAIIDLAEGESMRRTSVQRIKSLISDSAGTHRTFASGEVKQHPVRYVMSITNNDSPLVDNTGNRRFLVVKPTLKKEQLGDIHWLKAYRAQIFAEGVAKYKIMVKQRDEIQAQIDQAEEEQNGEILYELYKKQSDLGLYERKLSEMGLTSDDIETPKAIDIFRSSYGVPYIPQEISEDRQASARMKSQIEYEIQAVLMSYDEYRAGVEDFFITTQEIIEQLPEEAVRQSRMGSYLLSESGRLVSVVDERLEKYRARSGEKRNKRGFRFIYPLPDAEERLEAIERLRNRAQAMKPLPPSQFGGGSKAVTLEQKAAKCRWERIGDAYVVIADEDIEREMEMPSSVDVSNLFREEQF